METVYSRKLIENKFPWTPREPNWVAKDILYMRIFSKPKTTVPVSRKARLHNCFCILHPNLVHKLKLATCWCTRTFSRIVPQSYPFACAYLRCMLAKTGASLRWPTMIWHDCFAIEVCKKYSFARPNCEAKRALASNKLLLETPSLRVMWCQCYKYVQPNVDQKPPLTPTRSLFEALSLRIIHWEPRTTMFARSHKFWKNNAGGRSSTFKIAKPLW